MLRAQIRSRQISMVVGQLQIQFQGYTFLSNRHVKRQIPIVHLYVLRQKKTHSRPVFSCHRVPIPINKKKILAMQVSILILIQ